MDRLMELTHLKESMEEHTPDSVQALFSSLDELSAADSIQALPSALG